VVLIVSILLLVISFYAKGKMDVSAKDGFRGEKKKWNKSESWRNKYDSSFKRDGNWWYFGTYRPLHLERFPFSSTLFVAFTDFWHFMQFIFLNCLFISFCLLLPYPIYSYIVIRIIYAISFNLSYEKYI
jgi:hypothetical protein